MLPQEIRDHINKQYELMDKMDLSHFTLNKAMQEISADIEYTQSICQHEFDHKKCIWCDKFSD